MNSGHPTSSVLTLVEQAAHQNGRNGEERCCKIKKVENGIHFDM
jgi:hypothetical protein